MQREKPPRAPKRRQHRDGEGAARFVPDSVFVAGGDMKAIISRWQFAVARDAAVADVDPICLMSFEAIFESRIFRRGEIEAGVLNFKMLFACGNNNFFRQRCAKAIGVLFHSLDLNGFNPHRRRNWIGSKLFWIH